MEMQPSPPSIGKRLWNMIRIVYYITRKQLLNTKLYIDLPMMLKRSKTAGKAIGNLMLRHHNHHYAALGCHPDDIHTSYISPQLAYEFSCSDSPAYFPTRKHNHHRNYHHGRRKYHSASDGKKASQKVFDVSRNYEDSVVGASPYSSLAGFGRSPITARQLRVTDSPFSLKDFEDDPQVDKAAEEFITKFYNELKQQKRTNTLDSPSSYHKWMR